MTNNVFIYNVLSYGISIRYVITTTIIGMRVARIYINIDDGDDNDDDDMMMSITCMYICV